MIIELPFSYKITGLEPKKRTSNSRQGIDVARINVRDVAISDFPLALVLLDEDGSHAETFRHFEGSFWIRDSRVDDTDFVKQHIMLMGEWPKKPQLYPGYQENQRNFTKYTKDDANKDNEIACKGLSMIGILAYKFIDNNGIYRLVDKDLQPKLPFRQNYDGTVSCEPNDPSDEFRAIEENDINEQRQKAVEYTQANIISVDGELWHRCPPPMIYANSVTINWAFDGSLGRPLQHNRYGYRSEREDTSISGDYKIAMTDFDDLIDVFPDAIEKQRIKFYIEHIDPVFFAKPDIRPLIIKDIDDAIVHKSNVLDEATPYVYKWLELRDLVKANGKKVVDQEDDVLDAAADILMELDAMLGKNRYPGAVMWANRQVDLSFPDVPPTPTF
jgi:hypothetical protein